MPSWKKIITSGSSDASLAALFVSNAVTSSIFSGSRFIGASFTGSLLGTASFATTASFINSGTTNAFVQGGNSFGAIALIGTNDNQNFAIETNGSTKVTVDTSGNVGIGATSPLARLHAGPNISDTSTYTFTNTGAVIASFGVDHTAARTNVLSLMRDGTSGVVYAGLAAFDLSRWSADGVNARTQLDIRLANTDTNTITDVISLRSNGNVGIGTTSPTGSLQVNGILSISNNAVIGQGSVYGTIGAASFTTLKLYDSSTGDTVLNNQGYNIQLQTAGSSKLTIANGGSVGIGTNTPRDTLDIIGSAILRSTYNLSWGNTYGAGVPTITGISGSSAVLAFFPAGSTSGEKVRINSNGDVGIGTTSPSYKLETVTTGTLGFRLSTSTSTVGNPQIDLFDSGRTQETVISSTDGTTVGTYIASFTNHPLLLGTNAGSSPTARLAISTGGNVGIGTVSPGDRLDVNGDVVFGSATERLSLRSGGIGFNRKVSDGAIYDSSRFAYQFNHTPSSTNTSDFLALQVYSGSGDNITAAALAINGAGNVGIGTSTPLVGRLQINTGAANNNALTIQATSQTSITYGIGIDASSNFAIYDNFAASQRVTMNGSGNVGIGTTSPTEGKLVIANSGPSIIYNKETSQGVNSFWNSSDGGIVQFGAASNHPLLLFTNNTEKVRITSAGNVGIGTNSPTYKLDIVGASVGTTAGTQELLQEFNVTTSNNDYLELTNTRVSNGSTWETAGFRIQQKVDSTWMGYIQFNGNNNGGISFGTGLNAGAPLNIPEALRIVNGGNIGVRVTSPSSYLDIGGAQDTAGQISLQLRSGNSAANFSSNQITLGYNNTDTYRHAIKTRHNSGAVSGNAIDFYTWKQSTDSAGTIGTQHVMSLDGPNVGIGVTSPTGKLHVSASGNPVIFVESDTDGDSTSTVLISGNKSGIANYTATTLELRSNIDYRGRGILMTYTGGSEKWFAGVPYTGGGYQIGYSTTAPYDPPNAALYINSSKNVGIGTTTPGQKLDVIGRLRFRSDTSTTPGFWLTGNDGSEDVFVGLQSTTSTSAFGVYSAASWRFTILNGGNVGIGTTNPQASLDVNGDILSRSNFALYNSNFIRTDSDLLYLDSRLGGRIINSNTQFVNGSTTGYSIYDNNSSGAVTISVINEGTINNIPNSTAKAMKISYSAAATPSPGYGGFYVAIVNSTSNGVVTAYNQYRKGQRIVHKIMANIPSGRTIEWASNPYGDNGFFTWLTSQSGTGNWEEYIGIQQIGTTGTFSSTGFYYISTGANTAFDWYVAECQLIDLDTPSEVQYSSGITIGYDTSYNSVTAGFGGLGVLGSVLIGGNLGVGTTGPAYKLDVLGTIRATGDVIAYSDARVKDNIEPIENALEKVISLRGVSYNRKDTDDKSRKIGVIAQEVLPIIPEVVSKDQNGNYSVAYGNMVGLLIEAVKEQQKQIDELKYLLENKKKKK